jgi:hypothetical protein
MPLNLPPEINQAAREKTAEDLWKRFEEKAVPRSALPNQRQDMKRCFYAGLFAMMTWQIMITDDDVDDIKEEESDAMTRMFEDVSRFLERGGVD